MSTRVEEQEAVISAMRGDDEWDIWVSDTVWIDKLERAGWEPVETQAAGGYRRFSLPRNALTLRRRETVQNWSKQAGPGANVRGAA